MATRIGSFSLAAGALVALTIGGVAAAPAGATTTPPLVSASNWSTTNAAPGNPGGSQLYGVSCTSSVSCTGVGNQAESMGGGILVEHWNGTSWSASSGAPLSRVNDSDVLRSVSCLGPSFCLAVGTQSNFASNGALAEAWNGSAWALVTVPLPSGATTGGLDSVSCVSTTLCEVLGVAGQTQLFGEQWNGSSLSLVPAATPPGGTSTTFALDGMACTSPTNCLAVGSTSVSDAANGAAIAEQWNGASWSLSETGLPGGFVDLSGVSCVGPSFCVAVGGTYAPHANTPSPLTATWNGSSWTPSTPSSPQSAYLNGVDCFGPTTCTAVGGAYSTGALTPDSTLVLNGDGSTWTSVANVPSGSSGTSFLGDVSCVTDWACMAVGGAGQSGGSTPLAVSAPIARSGYRFVASDGGVFAYGAGAPFLGSTGGLTLNAPVVGLGVMPAGDGYYLVASDGGIFNYGSAPFYGSTGSLHLNKPVVGMAVTPDGGGYWLVASDGGIFNYGDAPFYGSTGGMPLNKPIVGMAPTPDGKGYYLVASDGGIFAYGDATFYGSTGGQPLNQPIVGLAVPPSGGYYLVASDGGIFSFPGGAAGPAFYGSTGGTTLNKPIVGMATVSGGYYLAGSDGGIFSFPTGPGGPPFYGSTGGTTLNKPIVGIAS